MYQLSLKADFGGHKFYSLASNFDTCLSISCIMIPLQVSDGMLQLQSATSSGTSPASASKHNQRREASGSMIRSILLNNESRHGQTSSGAPSHQKIQILNSDNGKRLPRSINARSGSNDMSSNEPNPSGLEGDGKRPSDGKPSKKELHGLGSLSEKQEKRIRNKDRPDRGVWAPRSRSDASVSQLEESSVAQSSHLLSDSVEGTTIIMLWRR